MPHKHYPHISDLPTIASGDNHNIIIFVRNVQDGVGDFEHAVSVAEELQILRQHGYRIVGIIETEKSKEDDSSSDFYNELVNEINKRATTVSKRLESLQNNLSPLFDEAYLFEMDTMTDGFVHLDQKACDEIVNAKQAIEKGVLGLTVGYGSYFQRQYEKKLKCLNLRQYGSYGSLMGLPSNESGNQLGIKLYPEMRDIVPEERLLEISKAGRSDQHFIEHLLGTPFPTVNSAKNYLNSHYLIPGYLQNFNATTTFILSEIESKAQSEQGISKKFDFIIPGGAIDESRIREVIEPALLAHGINRDEILFINTKETQAELKQMSAPYDKVKVRIMSPFLTKREDYESLYYLTADGTGCSGDNTISVAFSGPALPYFQYKEGPIHRFYAEQLNFVLQKVIKENQDPKLKEGLNHLKHYFDHLTTFLSHNENDGGLFEAIIFTEPDSKYRIYSSQAEWENALQNKYTNKASDIITWCKKTGKLANATGILDAWKHLQNRLFQEYNFRDKLINLIQLEINEKQDLSTLLQAPSLKKLIDAKIVNPKEYNSIQLSKFIATEQIVNALLHKEIEPATVIAMKENELFSFKDHSTLAAEKVDRNTNKFK